MLDQRAATLLQVILSNRNITINQLKYQLNCTRRQVDYDLLKINNWLESRNLPVIELIRNKGLVIDDQLRSKVVKLLPRIKLRSYIPSRDDRLKLIFLHLFIKSDYHSLNHITEIIKMSRNSVLNDIQLLRKELQQDNIAITYNRKDGYNLIGNEHDIRSIAYKYIAHFLQLPNGMQLLEEIYNNRNKEVRFHTIYQEKYEMMIHIERELEASFVEEQLKLLTIFFMFLVIRIQTGYQISFPMEIKHTIKQSNVYYTSRKVIDQLSLVPTDNETTYISMHLLGLRSTNYKEKILDTDESTQLFQIIEQIISDFEKMACVTFMNREHISKELFLHLKPVYYRMIFNIPITNPYLDKLKREYHELFVLVKKSLKKLEELINCPISEDEVGYVTLHFGAFLKKQALPYRRKRCIIICPNGVSTSYMLKNQMEALIPEVEVANVTSPREFKSSTVMDIDFILSTVPIKSKKPVVIVSPILTALDKAKILQEVDFLLNQTSHSTVVSGNQILSIVKQYTTIHNEQALREEMNKLLTGETISHLRGRKPMLNELLTQDMIRITETVDNWEEAIRLAANPLLQKKMIEGNYIEAMIQNIKTMGPYIVLAPKVAIPHARPEDGVKKVGISLLKINRPVSFSEQDKEKDVNLIFVIAAIDNQMHLKALSQLTELLEDEAIVKQLIQVGTTEEMLTFINHFSR